MIYLKEYANIHCFSGLDSELHVSGQFVAENDIKSHIKSFLVRQPKGCADRISFSNNIMVDK